MLYVAMLLGINGAVIQGIFIKYKYFQLNAIFSLISLIILVHISSLLTLWLVFASVGYKQIVSELWFFSQLLFIPVIVISLITYFATLKDYSS